MNERLWFFRGGARGDFRVTALRAIRGESLPEVERLAVEREGPEAGATFTLRGVVSNERYLARSERAELAAVQAAIGRPEARHGALIPIRKSAEWWALPQDERRAIFEERSHHVAVGFRALPAVARRLHHCRDLGADEPFDFLTWFDFSPEDGQRFDDLLGALRETLEWQYVEREVELRVER
jgi:chlorite dismutase